MWTHTLTQSPSMKPKSTVPGKARGGDSVGWLLSGGTADAADRPSSCMGQGLQATKRSSQWAGKEGGREGLDGGGGGGGVAAKRGTEVR